MSDDLKPQLNEQQEAIKNAVEVGDNLVGDGIGLLSNKVAPVIGPLIVNFLWKNKWKILVAFMLGSCFAIFSLEAISLQYTASSRALLEQIPKEHTECIQKASDKYGNEFELIAAYGKVIADFDDKHTGPGKGFLEIDEQTWKDFGADGNDNKEITEKDLCDNYFTLSNKIGKTEGDAKTKIDKYTYEKRDEVLKWYELYKGISMIPYGNPVGLDRSDLVTVTSGYLQTRIIDGKKNIHHGVDMVPSSTWFSENPGKGSKEAVNRSIMYGKVTEFKDGYGALCVYVENDRYRTMICHCDSFIAQDQTTVKYGDPLCYMGTTGFSTGVHTHFGLSEKANGVWNEIDPTPFLFPTKQ